MDSTVVRPDVLALITQYGGMDRIPQEVLDQHSHCRFKSALMNTTTIEDVQVVAKAPQVAARILQDSDGYLFADDWVALCATCNGTHVVSPKDVRRIEQRAHAFKVAGIPPIFDARIQPNGFPLIDFLINWTTGKLAADVRMKMIEAMRAGVEAAFLGKMLPTTVEAVRTFCAIAFLEDGTIDPPLIEDAILYMDEKFEFSTEENRSFSVETAREAFRFLAEQLRSFRKARKYAPAPTSLEALNKRRWYVTVAPRDREPLLRELFASSSGPSAIQKARPFNRRIFPVFVAALEGGETTTRLARALATRNLAEVQGSDYEDATFGSELCELAMELFVARLEAEADADPLAFCRSGGERHRMLNHVVRAAIGLVRIIEALDAIRLSAFQRLTDEQFLGIVGPNRTATGGLGSRKQGIPTTAATRALRTYIQARSRSFERSSTSLK